MIPDHISKVISYLSGTSKVTEAIGVLIVLSLIAACALIFYKMIKPDFTIPIPRFRKEKDEKDIDTEDIKRFTKDKSTENEKEVLEQKAQIYKERAMQEQERAKKLEEKYDELRVEYETVKDELKKKDKEIKEKEELVKTIEEESRKLATFIAKRYKKGHYIPAVLWTRRGNALPYKFVVEMGWVNGGWRALLVDSITADPETGEWFPALDKPAPSFLFRDDPGFQPDNPEHSVLFDVNRYEFEEDLKVTRADPHAKPVALVFGVDEDGNPIHKLQYGSGLHINTLRAENRKLKLQVMKYMHMLKETEVKLNDAEYRYQMERDLREHLEKEIKLLRAQLYETRDVTYLLGDELEAAREAFRTQQLRRYAAVRRAEEAEKMFDAYYGRPQIYETSIQPYLEQKSKEKDAKMVALLAPVARREASIYDIDKRGKSDEEIVDEWIKKKVEKEGVNGWLSILKELGLDMTISDIVKEGMM